MKYFNIKFLDIVLIALLVLASFIPNALFAYQAMSNPVDESGTYLVINVDNQELERIKLDDQMEAHDHMIKIADGKTNTLHISAEGIVKMINADCPDKRCMKFLPIAKNGEQIICLPHKLIVEIQGGENSEGDLNAY